jgi:hypothetical protein
MNHRTGKKRNSQSCGCSGSRTGEFRSDAVMFLAFMALAVTAVPDRLANRARGWAGAVLRSYCFYLATEPVEAGSYFGLPSVPDGMPVGVLILLAAFVIVRRAHMPGRKLRNLGIGG